jgi:hypothetical protein
MMIHRRWFESIPHVTLHSIRLPRPAPRTRNLAALRALAWLGLACAGSVAAAGPLPPGWQPVEALEAVDVSSPQRLAAPIVVDLASGASSAPCPAGAWTGQATFTNGAGGKLTYWGTGWGCAPHGVGTLQYQDGTTYFGRVTSYFASRGAALERESFRPAVREGQGQFYAPATGQQQLGLFARDAFVADRAGDAAFVGLYTAAFSSIADRAAPTVTPAVAALFASEGVETAQAQPPPAMAVPQQGPQRRQLAPTSLFALPPELHSPPRLLTDQEWLDRVLGPQGRTFGIAPTAWENLRFEGALTDGVPDGRGVVRDVKSGASYEGRYVVRKNAKGELGYFWDGPLLTRSLNSPSSYGPAYVMRYLGDEGSNTRYYAPSPAALAERAQERWECPRPSFVPVGFVAWSLPCVGGQLHGKAEFFTPDLRHQFELTYTHGHLLYGTLTADFGTRTWTGQTWAAGAALNGRGVFYHAPFDMESAVTAWRTNAWGRQAQRVFNGVFERGVPVGEGLCGPVLDICVATRDGVFVERPATPLPQMSELAQIQAWEREIQDPAWQPDVKTSVDTNGVAQGKQRWVHGLLGGWGDCHKASKRGALEVEKGGSYSDGFQRYKGGWGSCGPAGYGVFSYSNGNEYVGQVHNRGLRTSEIGFEASGLGLWRYPNGRRVLMHGEPGKKQRGLLAFGAADDWWAQGSFDENWNANDGLYTAADGSTFRGALKDARPGGAGVWQNATGTLRAIVPAHASHAMGRLHGVIEFTVQVPLSFVDRPLALPPGRYLASHEDGWSVGSWLNPVAWIPAPETLLSGPPRGACPVNIVPPTGWRVWWPSCSQSSGGVTVTSYSPDRRYRLFHRIGNGSDASFLSTLNEMRRDVPTEVERFWIAQQFSGGATPAPLGRAELYEGGKLVYEGGFAGLNPDGAGMCAKPKGEGDGMEPCEHRGGQRVDQIHHLRQQRLAMQRQQEETQRQQAAAQAAEQQRLAQLEAQRRAAAAAAQAQQEKQGGFQWGKFAALTTGAVAGGLGKMDADTQANILTGIIRDSASGNEGISNFQGAAGSVAASNPLSSGGYASGGAGGGKGAVTPGSYPTKPPAFGSHPACSGYTVDNYKQVFEQNANGPDVQLHTHCAGAYNYYWMYLNAIRQGYAEHDANRTYAAHADAARVAMSFYDSAR